MSPMLRAMIDLVLMRLWGIVVGGAFADGMAMIFSERPSSNRACETVKLLCS